MRSSPICRPQYNLLVPVDVNHRLFLNIIFSPPYRVSSSPCNTKRIYHFVFIYLLFGNLRESRKFPPPLSYEKKKKKKFKYLVEIPPKFHLREVRTDTPCMYTPTQILVCMMIAHILPSSWMVRFFFFHSMWHKPRYSAHGAKCHHIHKKSYSLFSFYTALLFQHTFCASFIIRLQYYDVTLTFAFYSFIYTFDLDSPGYIILYIIQIILFMAPSRLNVLCCVY